MHIFLVLLFFVDIRVGAEERRHVKPFTFHEGRTGAGNSTIVTLNGFNVPLRVILHSIEGDADLYLSVSNPNVSFFLEDHDRSSATCGIDYVDIPVSNKSYLSIYGHPFHAESKWRLLCVAGHNSTFSEGEFDFEPEVIYLWDRLKERENELEESAGLDFFFEILGTFIFEFAHILITLLLP